MGKDFSEVAERQKHRQLAAIKDSTEVALQFVESYQLEVKSVFLQSRSTKEEIVLNFFSPTQSSQSSSSSDETQFSTTGQVLFLLDKYGVSDDFYHEMSMIDLSLPRSCKVKELRKNVRKGRIPSLTPSFLGLL